MAIILESEFRSVMAPSAGDSPRTRPAGLEGEDDFASSLRRVRERDTEEASPSPADALPTALPQAPLTTSAWTETSGLSEPALTPQAAIAEAEPALVPVQTPSGDLAEVTELETDRDLVRADIEAAQAGIALADPTAPLVAGPPAGPASTPAAAPSAGDSPQESAPVTAQTSLVTTPVAGAGTASVVAAGLGAVPVAQTLATGDKAPPGPLTAAPKATSKVATIAQADGNGAGSPSPVTGPLPESATAPVARVSEAAGLEADALSAQGSSTVTFATMTPGAPQQTAQVTTAALPPFASPNPVLVAVPTEIVDIVSKSAEDGQSDRVVVQLDPPELGRVSIDFKFDAQGLQHVIITSETPEAMRQLRQMHSELVQALERQGLGNQNMTFQHQQQSSQQSPLTNPLLRMASPSDAAASAPLLAAIQPHPSSPRLSAGGRLDIRL